MVIEGGFTPPVLLFTQSQERAQQLAAELNHIIKQTVDSKHSLTHSLHGGKDWKIRQRIL